MWRYIVVTDTGGYLCDMKQPDRPMVIVHRADAHRAAREWSKSEKRPVRVRRISTQGATYRWIMDALDPNPAHSTTML